MSRSWLIGSMVTMTSTPSYPRRAAASKASGVRSGKTEAVDSATCIPAIGATWPKAPPPLLAGSSARGTPPPSCVLQLMPPGDLGGGTRPTVGTARYRAGHGKVGRRRGVLPVLGVRLAEHEVGGPVRRVPAVGHGRRGPG